MVPLASGPEWYTSAMEDLDEADISLIHALQLRPRASWRELASALGEGPATLSKRWARLRESAVA